MANINKYLQLAKAGTGYARKMNHLSNRIFGEITRPTSLVSQKVSEKLSQQPMYKNPDVVDYYHRLPETHYLMVFLRNYGLFRDEHADFREEMQRRRKLRGKGLNPKFTPQPDRASKFSSLRLK